MAREAIAALEASHIRQSGGGNWDLVPAGYHDARDGRHYRHEGDPQRREWSKSRSSPQPRRRICRQNSAPQAGANDYLPKPLGHREAAFPSSVSDALMKTSATGKPREDEPNLRCSRASSWSCVITISALNARLHTAPAPGEGTISVVRHFHSSSIGSLHETADLKPPCCHF